jgi:hypothetical protein
MRSGPWQTLTGVLAENTVGGTALRATGRTVFRGHRPDRLQPQRRPDRGRREAVPIAAPNQQICAQMMVHMAARLAIHTRQGGPRTRDSITLSGWR